MSNQVILYSDANYSGSTKFLDLGKYNTQELGLRKDQVNPLIATAQQLAQVGIGNDGLSSLRVPAGYKVVLYEHGDFSGRTMVCVADTPSVGESVNDRISSIAVEQLGTPKVILYTDQNHAGWSQELEEGDHPNLALGNDTVTSLRVPDGYKVTLYEHGDFSGRHLICVADTPYVGDSLNDRISCVRIEKLVSQKVMIFVDRDYAGASQELDVGPHTNLGIGNDALSSLRVPDGFKVTLFESGPSSSNRKMVCYENTPYVGDSANDRVTSVIVERGTSKQVRLYTDEGFIGWNQELGVGRFQNLGIGNDTLSSIRVPEGYKVTLYEHGDFTGRQMVCVMDTPDLGPNVKDRISSVVVEALSTPKVILYNDSNFRGWSYELDATAGDHDLASSIGKRRLSSVIIPPGCKVTLSSDPIRSPLLPTQTQDPAQMILVTSASSLHGFNDLAAKLSIAQMQSEPPPTRAQLEQMIELVGPRYVLHAEESFCPSSVEWFLARATLRRTDDASWTPATGKLPAGGRDDGAYWLEIGEEHRRGDLDSAVAYVNAKYYTYWIDLQFWFFYPHNGPGKGYLEFRSIVGTSDTDTINLEPMGQHGGDWEHCTVRLELASRTVLGVYMAAHSGGEWVQPGKFTTENGRPVVFSSRNGHGGYKGEGMNGSNKTSIELGVGTLTFQLRNDTDAGTKFIDANSRYEIVSAIDCSSPDAIAGDGFLGSELTPPTWLSYCRRWGPRKTYDRSWIKTTITVSLGVISLSSADEEAAAAIMDALPEEYLGENGPTGPSRKAAWTQQE